MRTPATRRRLQPRHLWQRLRDSLDLELPGQLIPRLPQRRAANADQFLLGYDGGNDAAEHDEFEPRSHVSRRPAAATGLLSRLPALRLPENLRDNPHWQAWQETLHERLTTRPSRRTLAVTASVLALAGVLSLLPGMVDGTRHGQKLATQLAEATGQRVRIAGPINISLWPTPHIALQGVSLANPATGQTWLSVPRLDMHVGWVSLLSGEYAADDITLQQPAMDVTAADMKALQLRSDALPVQLIHINDGRLTFAAAQTETISEISGSVQLANALTLLQASLSAQWRDAPLRTEISFTPESAGLAEGYVSVDVGAAEASLNFFGTVNPAQANYSPVGRVDVEAAQGSALWGLLASLGQLPPAPADQGLASALKLRAEVDGSNGTIDMKEASLRLGEWEATGLARMVGGASGGLSLALRGGDLDLAAWPSLMQQVSQRRLDIPASWIAAFDLSLDGSHYGTLVTGPIVLKGDVAQGALTFKQAAVTLPGATTLGFSGQLKGSEVSGDLNIDSLQLREFLQAAGQSLPADLPEGALRQLKARFKLAGPMSLPAISEFTATLDNTQLSGQLSRRADGSQYDANLRIDQMALGTLLQGSALPGWLWQLPPSNVNLSFGQLSLGDQVARDVTLSASLTPGRLTLTNLVAADFGGNVLRLSGSMGQDANADTDLTLRLTTPDFAKLQALMPAARALVPLALADRLSGASDMTVRFKRGNGLDQKLYSLGLGSGKLELVTTSRAGEPEQLKLRLQNRDTAELLRLLAPQLLVRRDATLGLTDIYFEARAGEQPQQWQVSALQGQLAGLQVLGGNMTYAAGSVPQVSGQVQLRNANLDLISETIDTAALGGLMRSQLLVEAVEMTLGGEKLGNVSAQVSSLGEGQYGVRNLSADWSEGKLAGNLQFQLAPTLALKTDLLLTGANVNLRGSPRYGVSGMMDMSLKVEGRGHDMASLMASLNGEGDVTIDGGDLSGVNFAALANLLSRTKKPEAFSAQLERGGESPISTFGGDFVIEDGQLKAPVLRLNTPSVSAEAKVDVDLTGPLVTATADVTFDDIDNQPVLGVAVNGPPQALAVQYDTTRLLGDDVKPVATGKPQPKGERDANDEPPAKIAEGQAASLNAISPAAGAGALPDGDIVAPSEPVPPTLPPEVAPADEKPSPAAKPAAQAVKPAAAGAGSNAARRAPSTVTAPTAAGPSVQDILNAIPKVSGLAEVAVKTAPPQIVKAAPAPAVKAAAPVAAPSAGMPKITFSPAPVAPVAAPAPAVAPAPVVARPQGSLAPEFAGEGMTPVKEIKTDGLTLRVAAPPAAADDDDTAADEKPDTTPYTPPSSPDELMKQTD